MKPKKSLTERYGAPPFSVLDARQGYWSKRKALWLSTGLKSHRGRAENMGTMSHVSAGTSPDLKKKFGIVAGVTTSVFDPVLCELIYRWFSPPGGVILDPFAGGSVRGVVAAMLGRRYVGIDLSGKQIKENRRQWREIKRKLGLGQEHPAPRWIVGDSREIKTLYKSADVDFICSCPPYHNLEVYSDDPRDLSRMHYVDFVHAYRAIIRDALSLLKPNRFSCFVVGDIRDGRGFYRNFPGQTVSAFERGGAKLYNDAIMITPYGTLPLRAGTPFRVSRKLGKGHQNVLVFCSGSPKAATEAIGNIDRREEKDLQWLE